MRAAGAAAAPAAPAATAGPSGRRAAAVTPPSRDELMLIDAELREAYTAATLMPDGRSRRGRKTKHDTATRRWIDTVGFPCVELGKRPPETDMAMLKLTPRSSLSGTNLTARDAWSQLHGRDPRSKQQTAAEQVGQQTLLSWARTNLPLEPATVRRGRVSSWKLTFGRWKGYTPRQLALSSAAGGAALPTQQQGGQGGTPPGPYLLWITGQHARNGKPAFKWSFPTHFFLYLAMRELEGEGRVVNGNEGSVGLMLPAAVHRAYEAYADIRLTPAEPDAGDANGEQPSPPSPATAADDDNGTPPTAGALRVPPPAQPVDPIEASTPREQVEFFKKTLNEMSEGELPPYKEWERLQVPAAAATARSTARTAARTAARATRAARAAHIAARTTSCTAAPRPPCTSHPPCPPRPCSPPHPSPSPPSPPPSCPRRRCCPPCCSRRWTRPTPSACRARTTRSSRSSPSSSGRTRCGTGLGHHAPTRATPTPATCRCANGVCAASRTCSTISTSPAGARSAPRARRAKRSSGASARRLRRSSSRRWARRRRRRRSRAARRRASSRRSSKRCLPGSPRSTRR